MLIFSARSPHTSVRPGHSRSLLDVSADEFGNMLKSSESGFVGIIKDRTPALPPPWKYQSPAIRPWNVSGSSATG